MEVNEMIQKIAKACDDKQANRIIVLDMENVSLVADYFLICDASNPRQVQAIAKAIKETVEEQGEEIRHTEGYDQGKWIVIDTGYVLCHVFHTEERETYNLERLWGDADRVELDIAQAD